VNRLRILTPLTSNKLGCYGADRRQDPAPIYILTLVSRPEGNKKVLLHPALDLPDDTPLEHVRFSTKIRNALEFGGFKLLAKYGRHPMQCC
jgi:hypothetical protein